MRKKIFIGFLAVFLAFSVILNSPKKAEAALPLAVPAVSGGFALGALAVGGLAALIGFEFGDEIYAWGHDLWNRTSSSVKTAIENVSSWVESATNDIPDLKIDTAQLEANIKDTLKKLGALAVSAGASSTFTNEYIRENTAEHQRETEDGIPYTVTTAFPNITIQPGTYGQVYVDITDFDITSDDSLIFMFLEQEEVFFSSHLNLRPDSNRVAVPKGEYLFKLSSGTLDNLAANSNQLLFNVWTKSVKSDLNYGVLFVETFEQLKALVDPYLNMGLFITTVGEMKEMFNTSWKRTFTEKWEEMLDAGLVVSGGAVLEANPDISWDAERGAFVDSSGAVVNTGELDLPVVGVYDGIVGYPRTNTKTGEREWVDITTGVGVPISETGNPANPPKESDYSFENWKVIRGLPDKFPFSIPWDIKRAFEALFGGMETGKASWDIVIGQSLANPVELKLKIPDLIMEWTGLFKKLFLIIWDIGIIYALRKWFGGSS